MAQVIMGKLLPNLNISVDKEAEPDDMIEDGELSDDEDISEISFTYDEPAKNVDIIRRIQKLHNPKVYENKNGGFITGLDLSSEVLMKKLEDRAERFGLEKKEEAPITQNEIDALYKSLEIDPTNLNSCQLKNIRLDALHMRGVDDMSTNEIFKYFGKYGPASVEWINDCSCNVVWLDDATTARALLGKSQPLVIKKKDANPTSQGLSDLPTTFEKKMESEAIIEMSDSDEEDDDSRRIRNFKSESAMDVDASVADEKLDVSVADEKLDVNVVESTSVDIPVPPGHWRVGEPHPKAKALLLRFATKDDRKVRGAEKRSHYYQKYGNPNYGGMTGLISQSRKRKMQAAKNRQAIDKFGDESNHSNEYNSGEILNRPLAKASRTKLPRMRMYADEEEKKAKGGGFRQAEFKPKPGNIHSRLGIKYTKEDLIHLGSKFSSDSEEEVEDNIEINCTVPSRFNIWTDLAKSMAKEDSSKPRTDYSSDLESDLDSYRNLRSTFQDSRNSRLTFQDSRSKFQDSGNLKRPREPRTRDDRMSRDRLGKGDLRSTLSSHSKSSRDISPDGSREDLRSKIRRLKKEDSDTRKYRSPLLMDD